jgi:hypothetical protein
VFGDLLDRPAGKWSAIAFVVVAVGTAGYFIKESLFPSVYSQSTDRYFVDAATGKPYKHELQIGESMPVEAPSGGKTGYPAELCYWTADGQVKSSPTPVLLNSWIGKPGPTFCPDCGRLVVANNPYPRAGGHPPPTREEWEKWHQMGKNGTELLHSVASGN